MPSLNKSSRITFTVLAPAMMPPNGAAMAPVPDPNPMYMTVGMITQAGFPPSIGMAIVAGGTAVGSEWYGCTYTSGPYVIPGMGKVSVEPIG